MDRQRIFPSRVVTIVKAIISVFSRAKHSEIDVVPEEGKRRRVQLTLHKFCRRRERGSLRYYTSGNDGLTRAEQPGTRLP